MRPPCGITRAAQPAPLTRALFFPEVWSPEPEAKTRPTEGRSRDTNSIPSETH